MPFTNFDFDFKFLNARNKPTSVFYKNGVIGEDYLSLDNQSLLYADIQEVIRFRNQLSFIIRAGAKTALDEIQLPHTNSFVIEVKEDEAFDIKSLVDRQYTAIQMEERKQELIQEAEGHNFRSKTCPKCSSHLDLSYIKPSKYIFCKYCESIFNKYGNYVDLADYRICPVCEYYNRVQTTPKVHVYFLGKDERRFSFDKAYQCDSCTERELRQRFWKNLPFVIGAVSDTVAKGKIESDIDASYEDLTKANRLSYEGRINEAIGHYKSMFLYVKDQPGVLYDVGKGYLDAALMILESGSLEADDIAQPYIREAVRWLSRSLRLCTNYLPVIELFERHAELEYEVVEQESLEENEE